MSIRPAFSAHLPISLRSLSLRLSLCRSRRSLFYLILWVSVNQHGGYRDRRSIFCSHWHIISLTAPVPWPCCPSFRHVPSHHCILLRFRNGSVALATVTQFSFRLYVSFP